MQKWSLACEQRTWVLCRILHDPIYPSVSLELAHLPAAKEATSYMGVKVQSDRWTGSILRSSLYDLIDWHWFLWRYLVVFRVSFRNEVVTPGVTATSVLTSAECQPHMSSVWLWSGMPKVCLYNTFLGGLRHSHIFISIGISCVWRLGHCTTFVKCQGWYTIFWDNWGTKTTNLTASGRTGWVQLHPV